MALCELQNPIQELNYTDLLETIISRGLTSWKSLEDCEPLEAFAIGALGVKYSNVSEDLRIQIESLLYKTEKEDLNLSSIELTQIEGVLSKLVPKTGDLEQLNRNKLLRHRKMFYKIDMDQNRNVEK